MITIGDLRKEILNAKRSGDKERSKVLTSFLELALKIAKDDGNREANDKDLESAIKKEVKMAEQSRDAKAPFSPLVFELAEQFLPKQMSEREIENAIDAIISDHEGKTITIKTIATELRDYGSAMNMKIAMEIIKRKGF